MKQKRRVDKKDVKMKNSEMRSSENWKIREQNLVSEELISLTHFKYTLRKSRQSHVKDVHNGPSSSDARTMLFHIEYCAEIFEKYREINYLKNIQNQLTDDRLQANKQIVKT